MEGKEESAILTAIGLLRGDVEGVNRRLDGLPCATHIEKIAKIEQYICNGKEHKEVIDKLSTKRFDRIMRVIMAIIPVIAIVISLIALLRVG